MSSQQNFLDSDPNILEKNLKFVKNELEEELDQLFTGQQNIAPPRDYKVVTPTPGLCIKCFKVNTNEKYFINLCQTDGIPPPEDITESELREILISESPSSYRIPMSISEPRTTKDKSGNSVDVCDIAINPKFFMKCQDSILFNDFLVALILEALSEKYNVQVKTDNWLILKNRKFIGALVSHRVQNRDVKAVYKSYQNPSVEGNEKCNQGQKLIEEINTNEVNLLKNQTKAQSAKDSNKIKEQISLANSKIPEHKIIANMKSGNVEEILAEFFLPECVSANEITLEIGEDRISVESMKRGYIFDKFIDYNIDQDKVVAKFDKGNKMLQVRFPGVVAGKI